MKKNQAYKAYEKINGKVAWSIHALENLKHSKGNRYTFNDGSTLYVNTQYMYCEINGNRVELQKEYTHNGKNYSLRWGKANVH